MPTGVASSAQSGLCTTGVPLSGLTSPAIMANGTAVARFQLTPSSPASSPSGSTRDVISATPWNSSVPSAVKKTMTLPIVPTSCICSHASNACGRAETARNKSGGRR